MILNGDDHLQNELNRLRAALSPADERVQTLARLGRERTETAHEREKTVYAFVGAPGCGKTVLLRKLEHRFGITAWHPGSLARSLGPLSPENERRAAEGLLLEGYNDLFLSRICVLADRLIFIDGFPRNFVQAELLLQCASLFHWKLRIVELAFPEGHEIRYSLKRQQARTTARCEADAAILEENERSRLKLRRACASDLIVAEALRLAGVSYLRLDALEGSAKSARRVATELEEFVQLSSTPQAATSVPVSTVASQRPKLSFFASPRKNSNHR